MLQICVTLYCTYNSTGFTEFVITSSMLRDGSLPLPNPPNG